MRIFFVAGRIRVWMYVRRTLMAIYRLSLEVSHSVTCMQNSIARTCRIIEARTVCRVVNMHEARMQIINP